MSSLGKAVHKLVPIAQGRGKGGEHQSNPHLGDPNWPLLLLWIPSRMFFCDLQKTWAGHFQRLEFQMGLEVTSEDLFLIVEMIRLAFHFYDI